jgi:hypothetical protein
MQSIKSFNLIKLIHNLNTRTLTVSNYQKNKNVAVVKYILFNFLKKICFILNFQVLSGCGVYDGSEIIEAVSCMIHLSKHNANVSYFAPNIEQMHVINHSTGEIQPETRLYNKVKI